MVLLWLSGFFLGCVVGIVTAITIMEHDSEEDVRR